VGLPHDRIVLSCKVSGVQDLIAVYRDLAARCDYALHLGLTEAGMGSKGIVASTAAMAVLLQEGIGDTIRVSLTPEPGGDRTKEVIVAQEILQTMGLRSFAPMVIACPGCGRTTSTFFQELADRIQSYLRAQMPVWRTKYAGVENMHVAVMGCVVNGPGESKHANVGISLPGSGENPVAPVYVDGVKTVTLKGIVKAWRWSNPHCLLTFDVKGEDGQVVQWLAETQAPNTAFTEGYRASSFKPGDEVTITVQPAANGRPFGMLAAAVLADGTKLGNPEGGRGRGRGAAQ